MMNINDIKKEAVLDVAKKIMIAAKTAPKARGKDLIEMTTITDNEIVELSNKVKEMYNRGNYPPFFLRDAENILSADALILIGTKIEPIGLEPCGLCGHGNCEGKLKHPDAPCAFNTGDLGIAIGSAVSIATDNRVDNRIMYTVGLAANELQILGKDVKVCHAIPLSVSAKNPFFDRK